MAHSEVKTDLKVMKLGLWFSVGGLSLIGLSEIELIKTTPWIVAILSQLGGLLLVTGLLSVGWEKLAKRELTEEVLEKAGLGERVRRSGLVYVGEPYADTKQWSSWLSGANPLEVVVAYSATWRNANRDSLRKVADTSARVRVALPDLDHDATLRPIAQRFNISLAELRTRIREAQADFDDIFDKKACNYKRVQFRGELLYNMIRCGPLIIVTLYSHTRDRRTNAPILGFKEGTMQEFLRTEISTFIGNT